MNGYWKQIEEQISKEMNKKVVFITKQSVSGGCVNQCWKVTDSNANLWFIKINSPMLLAMFIAEFEGLNEIGKTQSIRSPKCFCYGKNAEFSYLVLEYISLSALKNQRLAGEQLAEMHHHYADSFGWHQNNTIGSTPQINQQEDNWVSFFGEHRLIYQLKLARKNGYSSSAYEKGLLLAENLPAFFETYHVKPSLLHGDLWGGNIASNDAGDPVIFDPAVYYGDREVDIAMTELFGGFNNEFYSAYNSHYQLDSGYETRKILYNLYHILNHYNLFGGGYASQAERMTDKLRAEISL